MAEHKKHKMEIECLVTGGSGLVGRALQRFATGSTGFVFVSSKDADLEDPIQTKALFDKYLPKTVVHLAAHVGGLYTNMKNNLRFFRANLLMCDNVLSCAYSCPSTSKCISCLSTCVFPDQIEYPIDETKLHAGPPHESNFGYSYAKRMIQVLNACYNQKCKAEGINKLFTSVIPTNIYGPHDNFNIENGHVIPALIHNFYKSALISLRSGDYHEYSDRIETEVQLRGSGKAVRQFIHCDDVARLILWVLRDYDEPDPIILSVDEEEETSIEKVSVYIACAIQYHLYQVKFYSDFDHFNSDGQIKKTASNKKLRSYLPDFKFKPLELGITETVEWFLKNYKEARK
ncbi:GDP-L-fucose synthase, partial [Fragariocoptes setiger]